jgi:hypothetical protein
VEPVEIGWVFRPRVGDEHAGKRVHAVGKTAAGDGRVEVVLADGERVRAYRTELSPE